ncbi:hypothetical protein XENOCAPTIV_004337 [Xenoophorus captivus]|uniref:Uncharacterized protein n=1 Tax=Xenoophorus captivus TaxID=1517983 RepID=A0ABV0RNR8_9TELE
MLNVRVGLVQSPGSPGGTFNVLVEFREHYFQFSMVKIPCDHMHCFRVFILLPTERIVEVAKGRASVSIRWYVHSSYQDNGKLTGKLELHLIHLVCEGSDVGEENAGQRRSVWSLPQLDEDPSPTSTLLLPLPAPPLPPARRDECPRGVGYFASRLNSSANTDLFALPPLDSRSDSLGCALVHWPAAYLVAHLVPAAGFLSDALLLTCLSALPCSSPDIIQYQTSNRPRQQHTTSQIIVSHPPPRFLSPATPRDQTIFKTSSIPQQSSGRQYKPHSLLSTFHGGPCWTYLETLLV